MKRRLVVALSDELAEVLDAVRDVYGQQGIDAAGDAVREFLRRAECDPAVRRKLRRLWVVA